MRNFVGDKKKRVHSGVDERQLTWFTVLLICGLGLYLRLGRWDQ